MASLVTMFVVLRLLLVAVGMFAWSHQIAQSTWRGVDRGTGIRYSLVPGQPYLDMWTRWDSWQYEEIARTGYWYDFQPKPHPYGTVACFPLYPMLIRGFGWVIGGNYVLAGLILANLAALVGFVLLFQWGLWIGDRRTAWLTVASAMTFPAGLFWSALYPQSLFFALSIGSLALMLDGRAMVACLLCGLATATRLEAVALIPALGLIRLGRGGIRPVLSDLSFLLTPLGLLGYMAYLQSRWGDPLLFLRVHALFGRGLSNPFATLLWPPTGRGDLAVVGTYGVLGLLLLATVARLRPPLLLYGWLLFLIPLSTGVFVSIYRIHLVNFPIYLAIGLGFRGRLRWLGWALVAAFLPIQCYMMFLWVSGYWLA